MVTLFRILQWIALISGESWDAGHDLVSALLQSHGSAAPPPWLKMGLGANFLPSLGFCFMVPNPQGCCKDSSLIPLRLVRGRGPVSPWGLAGCSAPDLVCPQTLESGILDRKDHQDSRLRKSAGHESGA